MSERLEGEPALEEEPKPRKGKLIKVDINEDKVEVTENLS